MKKLIVTIIFVVFVISCFSDTFGISYSVRSPKESSKPCDYEFGTRIHILDLMLLDFDFERQNGERYNNTELFLWQQYKNFRFTEKTIQIEEDSISLIGLDVRYKLGTHSIGLAQIWDRKPTTNLVVGEDIIKTVRIPFLFKAELWLSTSVFTNNLVKFNSETQMRASVNISSPLRLYYEFKERYYDNWNWSSKIGMEINY